MTNNAILERDIVDSALMLAEQRDWESVRLHQVADAMRISLEDIRHCFREKEDIVDAWFDRADQAMLKMRDEPGFEQYGAREKLQHLLMGWLDALRPHRRVTRQMILNKLEPGHIHYQLKGLLRVSRTVQWWREAAGLSSTLPLRAFEETALTSLYLATFVRWMLDDSADSQTTARFLQHGLDRARRFACLCNRCTRTTAAATKQEHYQREAPAG